MTNGVRVGAAAFVLGLALAGPQAVGVAVADTGEDESSAASVGSTQSPARSAPARRTARDAGPGTTARRAAQPASSSQDSPAIPSATGPRGAASRGESAVALPAATRSAPRRLTTAAERPAASVSMRELAEPVAALPSSGNVESEVNAAQSQPALLNETAANTAASTRIAPGIAAATSVPPQAARANPLVVLNTAVTRWFDDSASWLGTLPATPVSEFIQGALLLVRRSLFNQTPTTDPFNYLIGAFGDTVGTVDAIDPEGDALTYSLTQQPVFGTVEIGSDGTYTYTPGADFNGYDSFTVAVSDRGFNLLAPFSNRTTDAFVEVPYWSRGAVPGETMDFYIYNFTGQTMILRSVTHDPNASNPIEPKAPLLVHPGDTLHLEIEENFGLYSSLDPTRVNLGVPRGQTWEVVLNPNLLSATARTSCSQGYCTYSAPNAVLLVDAPGTVWDYSQDNVWGQQILNSLLKASQSLAANTVNLSYEDAVIANKQYKESDYSPTGTSATNNGGNETFKFGVTASVTQTTTKTSNWEVEASITPTILGVVDVALGAKYGKSIEISESRTFETTREFNAIPYSYNTVYAAAPQIDVTGDLKATFGPCTASSCTAADPNVTFWFRDVSYTYPDPTQTPESVKFYTYTRPYQEQVNQGFLIKDARAWDPNSTFPVFPQYKVGEVDALGNLPKAVVRGYVGATVASAEDFTLSSVLTSSNEAVATIGPDGTITALSPGTTRITATYSWAIPGDQSRQVGAFMDVTVVASAT